MDLNSIASSYQEVADTLKTPDWFNTALFPKAVFKSVVFNKIGDKDYQVQGQLSIRDKTVPIIFQIYLRKLFCHTGTSDRNGDFEAFTMGDWSGRIGQYRFC